MNKKALLICCISVIGITTNAQWTTLTSGTNQTLNSVYFNTPDTGIVVGDIGTLLKTTDGGATWTTPTSGTLQNLQSVFFSSLDTGYAVGNNGTVIKTINAGATWSSLSSGTSEDLLGVFFITSTKGWVVGNNNTILHTSNGGQTWGSYAVNIQNSFSWQAVHTTDTSKLMVGGNFQSFAMSLNSGSDWIESQLGSSQGKMCCAIVDFCFRNSSQQGYLITNRSDLLRTIDGGIFWTILDSVTFQGINSLDFPSSSTGWLVGSNIFNTTNSGITWNLQSNPTTNTLNDVFFLNINTGYAVGNNGSIIKTTNGGTTPVNEKSETGFDVSVFPNPIAQKLTIQIATKGTIRFSIFLSDLMGKRVYSSMNRSSDAGVNTYKIDRGEITNGIYFLIIRTDKEDVVRKVIFTD